MKTLVRLVLAHPWPFVLLVLAVSTVMTFCLTGLTKDPSLESFVPADHPDKVYFDEIKERFGMSNFILVGVVTPQEGGVFTPEVMELVTKLSDTLGELPDVVDVVSVPNIGYIYGNEDGLNIEPIMDGLPDGAEGLDALRQRISDWDLLRGRLVSEDSRATALMVKYPKENTPELRRNLYLGVMDVVEGTDPGDVEIYVAGESTIEARVGILITQDITRLMPLVYGVVILFLWLSFRRFIGVVLPLARVVVSVVCSMGAMALLKVPLNILSSGLPVLLTAVGTAYTIHILFHYLLKLEGGADRQGALVEVMNETGPAVLMAGLTTVAGFASLAISRVTPVRHFGLFAALGTGRGPRDRPRLHPGTAQDPGGQDPRDSQGGE